MGSAACTSPGCRAFTSARGIFPRVLPSKFSWGFWGRGGVGPLSPGRRKARTKGRCELGVPLAQSTATAALSVSPGLVCVKERELKADLLCHPDFGFCHCEFLFSFWKLLFSSLLGSPRGIETHRGAHPKHPLPHRSYSGSGEVGLGISDHKWGQISFQHALFFS